MRYWHLAYVFCIVIIAFPHQMFLIFIALLFLLFYHIFYVQWILSRIVIRMWRHMDWCASLLESWCKIIYCLFEVCAMSGFLAFTSIPRYVCRNQVVSFSAHRFFQPFFFFLSFFRSFSSEWFITNVNVIALVCMFYLFVSLYGYGHHFNIFISMFAAFMDEIRADTCGCSSNAFVTCLQHIYIYVLATPLRQIYYLVLRERMLNKHCRT